MLDNDLTCLILAGGMGSRLKSIVPDRQKVVVEIKGRPFLSYLLDQLESFGLTRVILCTGYRSKQVQNILGDQYGSLHIQYSEEQSPLGTAGALRNAVPLIHTKSVLVMNGDSYCDVNLRGFWDEHIAKKADASIVLRQLSDTKRFGRIQIDDNMKILQFQEKSENAKPGLINAGIYIINTVLLSTIPDLIKVSIENDIFPTWTEKRFYGYPVEACFVDIGTPDSYSNAEELF
jgi:NDP-sugar pyrophosphorylase family protein